MSNEEIKKIRKIYHKRETAPKVNYSPLLPANTYFRVSKAKTISQMVYQNFGSDLSEIKALDVGFGGGEDIFRLINYGVKVENIYGTEVIESRFRSVQKKLPAANLIMTDDFKLPFEDKSFDLVIQSTVFSSIQSQENRNLLASEMFRVLNKNGVIVSYDIRFNNPRNKDVSKIDKTVINKLFPNSRIKITHATLNPVLARKIAPISILLAEILEKVPWLCSHYYTQIRKN